VGTIGGTEALGGVEEVVLGVDAHLHVHVAVVLDHLGRRLGESKVPTTARGYRSLVSWAQGFGPVRCAPVWKGPAPTAPGSPAT
jgi:hypothetical protein